ncbi:MAG TPA: N-acetylmuramoyl-L-alanine amidase [Opitutaceae bacterium]|nr:N-acetylmuramoyl-L-alanine amidase [Opitutaceae bacterium]
MARSHARGLPATMVVLMLGGGCTAPASAQHRADATPAPAALTPPRPGTPPGPSAAVAVPPPPAAPVSRLWPFTRLYNVDYVDVRAIAERYGLKAAWVTSGRVMQLSDERGRVRLKFEDRSRDFYLDGVRVFMGETTVFHKASLYVSKVDVIKTVAPLLRPAERPDLLPRPPKLIVLDPGHGGNDPGNQNTLLHLDEKDLTLDVVQRLKKLLEARGYAAVLTRPDDRRVELEERANIAARAKADLFLSVHFNALPAAVAGRVTGAETYALTPQFQRSSGDEKKDKRAELAFPGNRLDYANVVLGYNLHRTLLADLKSSDRGYKRARYIVLCYAECPAALVEAAFLSNNGEARRLSTPEYRQQIAQAIADGVDAYAAALAAVHPPPAPAPPETHPPNAASP